jgi:hypothetical protein
MPPRTRLGLSAALLLFAAGLLTAAPSSNFKFSAPAGTSVHQAGEHQIQVTASARVTIYVVIQGTTVTGTVEPTVDPTDVTILLLDQEGEGDDTVLFEGRIRVPTLFESVIPHETGHGEG